MAGAMKDFAHPAVRRWFDAAFDAPTRAQTQGWPVIAAGRSTLLLAPTGSGKTLAAFLTAINRLMFSPEPEQKERLRILYLSPLKALGVDVERNLRSPIAGIRAVAERDGFAHRIPQVGIRSGDTPQNERARLNRSPPDILITTPESLYLLLTSNAREMLETVDTVIVDEIHSMVSTKRGAHLFLSLERLEALRRDRTKPLQRIGLSATQRPLDEIARLLGGGVVDAAGNWSARPVEIIDAGAKKSLELTIEVPVEDMSKLGQISDEIRSGPAAAGPERKSIWPSIHPRLLELIRAHRSTMIFVNSRRLAERLAAALNELAGEEIARAHHGSIARDARAEIEDRLKSGSLPALVATSSLELGIDMGAVDLVVQIEAPPSIASGLQRIGRASHQVGAVSKGVIFPKFRGDLLASAAASARMLEGKVEETFYPRNPLDVLAQQLVATAAMDQIGADDLFLLIRGAAPFADLSRNAFDRLLDMLSGRYPSDELADLRPRLTWDRVGGSVQGRQGAKRVAVINGGTIPDRGLYGVFLADGGEGRTSRRVGELDEEMVFESRTGDVFLLGASSWRIEEISHDRVLVSPAPGEPGKMPFWHGDRPGRPPEFGRAIGELSRRLGTLSADRATRLLVDDHKLDQLAAKNLLEYLADQSAATGEVPTDRTLILERFVDEVGDWRVCLLSPFGARVHAPWAMAIAARLSDDQGIEVDLMWSDDGMVFRLPEADAPPDAALFIPAPEDVEALVTRQLGRSSLFAARFRENAGRALLLPKRRPGKRTPLWAMRKRAADLLAVASQHPDFPIILETYRECLRDVFDLPALSDLLRQISLHKIRVATVETRTPSPFAASLLFSYVANFIYDGDAPLAERRAQALSIDHAQLRELLGEAELRELLDADAVEATELRLQRLDRRFFIKHADGLHDLLLSIGDLSASEIAARSEDPAAAPAWIDQLLTTRRIVAFNVRSERRFAAAEDVARYRDALGVMPPPGLPSAFLEPTDDALGSLLLRYARTHVPFLSEAAADRFGLGVGPVRTALARLSGAGKILEGEMLPGGRGREWCDPEVLRSIKQQSLAKLRKQVEPVDQAALGRFLPEWQGVTRARAGLDALLSVIEQLQGAPLPASALESEILPARVRKYSPADLDELSAAGEITWRGFEPIGNTDGRIALYLADHFPLLAPAPIPAEGDLVVQIRALLLSRGALFFGDLVSATKAFPNDVHAALWTLVWSGEVGNDTLTPLRSMLGGMRKASSRTRGRVFRSRRLGPPGSEGRWSLLPDPTAARTETERRTALARQLIERHGILTREAAAAEGISGGWSTVYPVLKAMEEAGKIRRGYFVSGLGAAQFAVPGAEERLRARRSSGDSVSEPLLIAATDPANPYGAALPWPDREGARAQRAAGSQVVLQDGELLAFIGRSQQTVLTFFPPTEPERTHAAEAVARALAAWVDRGGRRALLIAKIDSDEPRSSILAPHLTKAGFAASRRGFLKRRPPDA